MIRTYVRSVRLGRDIEVVPVFDPVDDIAREEDGSPQELLSEQNDASSEVASHLMRSIEWEFPDADEDQVEEILAIRIAQERASGLNVEREPSNLYYGSAEHVAVAFPPASADGFGAKDAPSREFGSGYGVHESKTGSDPGRPTSGSTDTATAKRLILEKTEAQSLDALKASLGRGRPSDDQRRVRVRLARAISEIRKSERVTSGALADALGCSERTIERLAA
jgi:hypothetical protein